MKRIASLFGAVLFAVAATNPYHVAATGSERTIILRVTTADSNKSLVFSGWYQTDESAARVLIPNRPTRFGVKLQTNSLSAAFRKELGESDISVEVVEFIGDRETGSVAATGKVVEVDVRLIRDGIRMTARPVEGP